MMAAPSVPHRPRLSGLLAGYLPVVPSDDRPVALLCQDSRESAPGALFCALAGSRGHGLGHAAAAVAQGAVAVLAEPTGDWDPARIHALRTSLGVPVLIAEGLGARLSALAGRFHGDPSASMDLIGITGTNGKTSVSQFLAQALDRGLRAGLVGTLGYGFPGELSPTAHTTPDAVRLQAILAELRDRGAGAVAMEVSSHALDQYRAAGVHFDTAVLTNLTRDHLDYHGEMEHYAQSKRRLFHMPGLRHAVLNGDDPFGLDVLRSLDPAVEPVLYGLGPMPQTHRPVRVLRALAVEPEARGLRLRVGGDWGEGELRTSLVGRFNASNLLAVLAVLLLRGYDLDQALARLERVEGVPGRMECFGAPGQPLVVVDYAHTPDALEKALSVLREHGAGRLICLFGCGGDRDRGKRPLMGAVAEHFADLVIVTDDNPRTEDGEAIVREILHGMKAPERARIERNRGRAIRYAVGLAGPRDLVLVAGKGHETTQQVGDLRHPFSDRAQVTQALNEWGDAAR